MKISFNSAADLLDGILIMQEELGYKVTENGDYVISVIEDSAPTVGVEIKNKAATITYGGGKARFFRGLAYAISWFKEGVTEKSITETPIFDTNGAMVDMSRNAVMNVATVKNMLRKMALMGFNMYMLYTEDTYEIPEYPYFGHLRGRYTKEEIKELDAYAIKLGIELIPCIQALGHLATHLKWNDASRYKDTANALLVGSDETYKLIDAMFRTISECFTTRRLHIGMDETHDLGTGAYLNKFGYRERSEIYFEHLEKVRDIAHSYGLKPMMWSDMFFRLAGKSLQNFVDYDPRVQFTEEVVKKIPKGVQPVFWDYYHANEDFYSVNIDKHHEIFDESTLFAGGVWLWSGHCPLFEMSYRNTIPALEACRKKGVKEGIATIWLNGAEASLIMSLAGLAWYASYDYCGGNDIENIKKTFAMSCNADYDSIINFELPEKPSTKYYNLTRPLLYSDPLLGKIDYHIKDIELGSFYRATTKALTAIKQGGIFASACDTIIALSSLLENKSDFSVRMKKAYDEKDVDSLKALSEEAVIIIEKLKELKRIHRASWMEYNKPFGWEVLDARYGAIISRFETVKEFLDAFIGGTLERIEELEAERLPYADPGAIVWATFLSYTTAGSFT